MSTEVTIVFREKVDDKFKANKYADVDYIRPFGASAMALSSADGTLIVPLGRIREIVVVDDGEEDGQKEIIQRS